MTLRSSAFLLIMLTILGTGLTACETSKPRKRMPVTPQRMVCTGGVPASITLYSPEEARLAFHEKAYHVERESSETGIKYANREISYWNKGISAIITTKDGTESICEYIPKAGL